MVESGKPIRTARGEATRCVDTLTFAAVEARRLAGDMVADASESGRGKLMFALRVPVGVVAVITPFNFPLTLSPTSSHRRSPPAARSC